MDIVISFDENYVMPAGVMLTSLFENNKVTNIHIHALLRRKGSFSQPIVDTVKKYGGKITCYDMSQFKLPSLPVDLKHQRANISIETYFRLFLSDILSPDIDKVLWLDCDIVIADSLDELWNEDISDYPVGVIPDYENNNVRMTNRLGYNAIYGYFNAGVLLINLKYWREQNIMDSFVEYISSHFYELYYHDQDVLNHEFYALKKELPLRFNFQSGFLWKEDKRNFSRKYFNQIDDAFNNPCIIHFTEDKPWFKDSTHPMREYWYKYQNFTEWKGQRSGSNKLKFKPRLKKILYLWGAGFHSLLCIEKKWKKLYKTEYVKNIKKSKHE